jgi:hypothetical protein
VRSGECLYGRYAVSACGAANGVPTGAAVVLDVDAWLTERAPAAPVAGVLRCAWRGDLGALRTPLPDECFDLFWVDDGSLWLSGPETTSWAPLGSPPTRNAVGGPLPPGRQEPWEEPKGRSDGLATGARDTLRYHDEYED